MKAAKTVMTSGDVARICKVSPQTVNKWYRSKRLQGRTIPGSRHRRFQSTDVVRFMKENNMPMNGIDEGKIRVLVVGAIAPTQFHLGSSFDLSEFSLEFANNEFDLGFGLGANPDCVVIDFDGGCKAACELARRVWGMDFLDNPIVIGLLNHNDVYHPVFDAHPFHERFDRPFDPTLLALRIARLVNSMQLLELV